MKEFHAQDGQRSSALSQALRDYAGLAESLKDRLVEADEAFDVRVIAEARKLAEDLPRRALEAAPEAGASAAATTIRNQLLRLMVERVGAIRKAAAHVFRRHPEIAREVTSAYERRRRASFAGEMVMTWSFEPLPAGTRITITAENVPPGISQADHDAGLRSSLENLARYLG